MFLHMDSRSVSRTTLSRPATRRITNMLLDAVAKEDAGRRESGSAPGYRQGARQPGAGAYEDEDDRGYEGEGIVADDDEY